MKNLFLTIIFLFLSSITSFCQDYYEFGEPSPNKGRFSITPGIGATVKDGGGAGLTGSMKVGYFLSRYLTIGLGYFYVQTNKEYENYIGSTPTHTVNFLVGGEFFQIGKKVGFHGTGGVGYGFYSSGGNLTTYLDAGVSIKLGESFLLQPQIMIFDWRPGAGLGFNFKL